LSLLEAAVAVKAAAVVALVVIERLTALQAAIVLQRLNFLLQSAQTTQ
tara:strand:- start:826 stop:969 length:144 start_codon:yes stop_codon:yes gene_type:complete